jgi:hypothetical protein
MGIFALFGSKRRISKELKSLNDECNSLFNDTFNMCRVEYGRELVEAMNLKSEMLETLEKSSVDGIREKIAEKILNLTAAYFKIIKENFCEKQCMTNEIRDVFKTKLDKAYELITSLNHYFYLIPKDNLSTDEFDETLNEAEALCNAISVNYYTEAVDESDSDGKKGDRNF